PPGSGGPGGGGPPKGGGIPDTFSFGRLEAEGWTPPKVVSNRHGQLTNGRYVLDEVGMRPHTSGSTAHGKSQFFYRVNEKELALDAAAYADEAGLWVGNKAKIVLDRPIGVHGGSGTPTNVINVYRTDSGYVHAAPGTP